MSSGVIVMPPTASVSAPLDGPEGQSPSVAKIAEALCAAQSEIQRATMDALNPHFGSKYATLASVLDSCQPALNRHGVFVEQRPSADGARVSVKTVLWHTSGERIWSTLTVTAAQPTPQAVGSAITYARRYALSAMVGVAPEDDDGNGASGSDGAVAGTAARKRQSRPAAPSSARPTSSRISESQREAIIGAARARGMSAADAKGVIERFGFASSADVTADKYEEIMNAMGGQTA